ncbi:NAC domain-containing protein 77-like [Panicum virgatum]|uniref:NAC domain-containing protein 77-like n=1 Tax=Panicum virgatum TaxID=38727 RepID=UPI0019D63C89|nr:NAC domain-containing protein 77-like [Panicum virgatum]
MEAYRFGFDLPPANKFDPTDADIVAHYLLPRVVGFPNPHGHAIIDADPCSCPPWEFMRRHGHADSDHAFFFGRPRPADPKKRVERAVDPGEDGVGGTWDGQKSEATRLVLSRAGGGAARLEVRYKRHNLSYYHGPQKIKTSGWVMYDYQIVDPPHLSGIILHRVKITDRRKKEQDQPGPSNYCEVQEYGGVTEDTGGCYAAAAGHQVVPPGPDQPGPSNYCEVQEYGGAVGDTGGCYAAPAGGNNNYLHDGGVIGETGGYYYVDDDGSQYLNQDLSCYMYHGDGSGGDGDCFFNVGDDNSFQCPDGGNAG